MCKREQLLTSESNLFFLRPLSEHSVLTLKVSENIKHEISQTLIVASVGTLDIMLTDEWFIESYPMTQVTVLLSFLKHQMNVHGDDFCYQKMSKLNSNCLIYNEHSIACIVNDNCTSFIGMLIYDILHPRDNVGGIISEFIEQLKSYSFANFFVSIFCNENNESYVHHIYDISKVYGVSESHFRKLSHDVFAKGPKKQLRIWRASRSALQLLDEKVSIVSIAYENGYSSSSHFSSEMKFFFGLSPTELRTLGDGVHEKEL